MQLQWDDKSQKETSEQLQRLTDSGTETEVELSDYEKQTKELKNIAWDFGEDLSRQIEAESILDITDERIGRDLDLKANSNKEPMMSSQEMTDIKEELEQEVDIPQKKIIAEGNRFVEEMSIDDSSEKLKELLESDNKVADSDEEELVTEIVDDLNNEIIIDDVFEEVEPGIIESSVIEEVRPDVIENAEIEDEISDKEFWESTSKYFEPYKPDTQNKSEDEITEVNSATVNLGEFDSKENTVEKISESGGVSMSDDNPIEEETIDDKLEENTNEIKKQENDELKSVTEDSIGLEEKVKQKPEFYKPEKKRNLIPFIVFPLLVIIASMVLYWYLEFYSKNGTKIIPKQIVLKSDNAKVITRSFDFPVTYPYPPKVNQTTISETSHSCN